VKNILKLKLSVFLMAIGAPLFGQFTGEIVYEYTTKEMSEKTTLALGKAFYYKDSEVSSVYDFIKGRKTLVDITNEKIYRRHKNVKKGSVGSPYPRSFTTFGNVQVTDTIKYLRYRCKVIEFDQPNYSSNKTHHIHYYPLELQFNEIYKKVPAFYGYGDKFFTPFGEKFVPLYIEVKKAKGDVISVTRASKIEKREIEKREYLLKIDVNETSPTQ